MTHLLLVASYCVIPLLGFSQQYTVATGGTAAGTTGSVSYSIGQIDYTNTSSADGSSNEGLQQPFEFFDPDASVTELQWGTSLFPNPTMDQVIIQLENIPEEARYYLYDLNGKVLLSNDIHTQETILDIRSFAAGSYLLKMIAPSKSTSTIQIIKH
ncbi:T9SS type A sorting domain-containing protein [Crocinitomicaceae bacterium]|nr:T9SS type A sorting domain-containing protein [Crocinitomicaceae bacterium]